MDRLKRTMSRELCHGFQPNLDKKMANKLGNIRKTNLNKTVKEHFNNTANTKEGTRRSLQQIAICIFNKLLGWLNSFQS